MAHDHNCFAEAAKTTRRMKAGGKRTGRFIYVSNGQDEDAHFMGNTAFAALAFLCLSKEVQDGHTFGSCHHCDAVALGMREARATFIKIMESAKLAGATPC